MIDSQPTISHDLKDIKGKKKEYVVPEGVPVPLTNGSVDEVKKKEWVEGHPDSLHTMAEYIADHITYVNFDNFVSNLVEVTNEVMEKIGEKDYVLVNLMKAGNEKSDKWVKDLMKDRIKNPSAVLKPSEVGEWLKEHPDINDLLYMDDAVFSGIQLRDSFLEPMFEDEVMKEISKERKINLNMSVPFISERFLDRYTPENLAKAGFNLNMIIPNESIIMPTLAGLLNREEDKEKAKVVKEEILWTKGDDNESNHELTYFQHKMPDYLSFNMDALHGSIRRGSKKEGYYPWNKGFIPEIKPPYKSGYKDWVKDKIIGKVEKPKKLSSDNYHGRLAEHITGIPLERMDELIEKVFTDRQEIIETYGLPDSTLLFENPEAYRQELFRVADEKGIKIMTHNDLSEEDKIKYTDLIRTGSAWYDDDLKAVVCSSTETVNQFKLRELTHEIVHGIDLKDKKIGQEISIEEVEYRAYIVADISKEKLEKRDNDTKKGVESLFSDGKIAGSCFSYYIEKSMKDHHEFFGGLKSGDGTISWY